MSDVLLGQCEDCLDGNCTMNCSSAVRTSSQEHLAASIWAGVFPQRATAQKVIDFRTMKAKRAQT